MCLIYVFHTRGKLAHKINITERKVSTVVLQNLIDLLSIGNKNDPEVNISRVPGECQTI